VVGSEIFYQCDQGSIPEGRMRAVCEGTLSWSPNPADLVCSRAAAGGNIYIDSLNVMAFDHNSSTAYIGEKMKRKTNS